MSATNDHSVGLREPRHRTREVLARVERGEAIDVTDDARLAAAARSAGRMIIAPHD